MWSDGTGGSYITKSIGGEYIVTVSNELCSNSDTMNLLVISLPTSSLDITLDDDLICFDDYKDGIDLLLESDNRYTYLWSDGSTENSINITEGGLYSVEISIGSCNISDSLLFKTYCPYSIYIPNAFTPNGDPMNNKFFAYGKNITEFNMIIFDRWGLEVFKTNDINVGWDGYYINGLVQQDVYVWQSNYTTINKDGTNDKHFKMGTVTVLR